jgi:hypothetical protein
VLAIAVVVSSLVDTRDKTPRVAAAGLDLRGSVVPVVVSDFWVVIVFTLLVAIAVQRRHRPATHKRLLLFASVTLIAPALSSARPMDRVLVPYVPAVLRPSLVVTGISILALARFDMATTRRLEPATLWGSIALVAATLITIAMAFSESGVALTRWLTGVA